MEFAKEMDKKGPYFNGDEVGLIDLVVAPWAVSSPVFLLWSVREVYYQRGIHGCVVDDVGRW